MQTGLEQSNVSVGWTQILRPAVFGVLEQELESRDVRFEAICGENGITLSHPILHKPSCIAMNSLCSTQILISTSASIAAFHAVEVRAGELDFTNIKLTVSVLAGFDSQMGSCRATLLTFWGAQPVTAALAVRTFFCHQNLNFRESGRHICLFDARSLVNFCRATFRALDEARTMFDG